MDAERTLHPRVTVAVQVVLRDPAVGGLERMLEALDNSAAIAGAEGLCDRVSVLLGDVSATQQLSDGRLEHLRARFGGLHDLRVHRLGAGTGVASAHNALARQSESTHLLFCDPGVVSDGRALSRLLSSFHPPAVGAVEARRIPVSHLKAFAPGTGWTSWVTTGFTMTLRTLFEQLDGFDADTFATICADVDYSWRVREAGLHVVHQPAAVVFHNDRIGVDGRRPDDLESEATARAALLLAHKWSREDVVKLLLAELSASEDPAMRNLAETHVADGLAGRLIQPRDPRGAVGTFEGGRHTDALAR